MPARGLKNPLVRRVFQTLIPMDCVPLVAALLLPMSRGADLVVWRKQREEMVVHLAHLP